MRVYHFVNRAFGLEDLRLRRLKVATFDDLNDPFEFLAPHLSPPLLRDAFRRTKAELATTFGLVCFSARWNNPVQWSHYAEKHRGICLGFDVPADTVAPVTYSRKRLADVSEQLLRHGTTSVETMLLLLTTKYSHWRYEAEWRAFLRLESRDPDMGLYFTDFSEKLKLVEVVVGAESTISRAELREALGDQASRVRQVKARLAFGTYRVVLQRDQKLWA